MPPYVALWVLCAFVAGALLGALGLYAAAFSLRKKSEAECIQDRQDLKGQQLAVLAALGERLKSAEELVARLEAAAGK